MVHNNNYRKDNKKPYPTSFTHAAKDIQQREEQTSDDSAFFDSFPQDIKNIITKLRITVDHIDSPRNYARDLIHELARQLDERRLCERGRISIKIKEILEDKILAGKVTERWIRKCLPPEYKREYTKYKRELSSLSEKKPGTESPSEQTITVGNNGQQTTSNEHDIQELKEPADTLAESVTSNKQSNPANLQKSDWKTGAESLSPEQVTTEQSTGANTSHSYMNLLSHPSDKYVGKECTSCLELQDEVTQLREALQRISIPTADQIPASESEFIIPKEKYEMVKDAMDKSKSSIFGKCDENKKFARAVADVDN
jgi:hypothetical protein